MSGVNQKAQHQNEGAARRSPHASRSPPQQPTAVRDRQFPDQMGLAGSGHAETEFSNGGAPRKAQNPGKPRTITLDNVNTQPKPVASSGSMGGAGQSSSGIVAVGSGGVKQRQVTLSKQNHTALGHHAPQPQVSGGEQRRLRAAVGGPHPTQLGGLSGIQQSTGANRNYGAHPSGSSVNQHLHYQGQLQTSNNYFQRSYARDAGAVSQQQHPQALSLTMEIAQGKSQAGAPGHGSLSLNQQLVSNNPNLALQQASYEGAFPNVTFKRQLQANNYQQHQRKLSLEKRRQLNNSPFLLQSSQTQATAVSSSNNNNGLAQSIQQQSRQNPISLSVQKNNVVPMGNPKVRAHSELENYAPMDQSPGSLFSEQRDAAAANLQNRNKSQVLRQSRGKKFTESASHQQEDQTQKRLSPMAKLVKNPNYNMRLTPDLNNPSNFGAASSGAGKKTPSGINPLLQANQSSYQHRTVTNSPQPNRAELISHEARHKPLFQNSNQAAAPDAGIIKPSEVGKLERRTDLQQEKEQVQKSQTENGEDVPASLAVASEQHLQQQESQPAQGVQGQSATASEKQKGKPQSRSASRQANNAEVETPKILNVVTKFSFATKGGIAAHNPYKQNQDAYLTNPHMMQLRHCHFFSVCDGHGHNGQEVSGILKHRLPFNIEQNIRQATNGEFTSYPRHETIKDALTNAFEQSNREVYSMVADVRFSGSTCVSLMTFGRVLYVANVGDSRAILIKAAEGGGCVAQALSRDHKPDDPEESAVILSKNGRIDSYHDHAGNPIGPMRVWLKHEDIPGLAMSRSFGDSMACRVGVNAIPEIHTYELNPEDKIIILASDGVWEFLDNQTVANIVYPFFKHKNAEGAAEALVRASFKRWKKEENVIDDITCIIVFLDVKW